MNRRNPKRQAPLSNKWMTKRALIKENTELKDFNERLYGSFKKLLDDYYELLKSKTSLSMEKLTDKERLAKLEEAKKLIDEGNAGLNKQGLLVDMRIKGNEGAVRIPKH